LRAKLETCETIYERELFEYTKAAADMDYRRRCDKSNYDLLRINDIIENTAEQSDYLNCMTLASGNHFQAVEIYEKWDIESIASRLELHLAYNFRDVNDKGI